MLQKLRISLAIISGLAAIAAPAFQSALHAQDDGDARTDEEFGNEYPRRALREGREGTASFSVVVGVDGKVKRCVITSSSGSADLDEATCSVITRRGRFKPATDDDGNPVEGTYSNSMRWEIPNKSPPAPAPDSE